MIEKLIMDRFGKFHNKKFNFKPVTIFVGKNESGKTTLFDALFQVLCSPKASKKQGKMLKARYSDSCKVKAVFTGEPVYLDEDEFLNLYAVRSGDMDLDLSSGSSWLEKVKSSLFTGGLDPQRLKSKFESLASYKGSLKHNKALQELEKSKAQLKDDLDALNEKRQNILTQETNVLEAGSRVERMNKEIHKLEKGIKEIENELDYQKKITERSDLNELLKWIEKGEEIRRRLESLEAFKGEEISQFDQMKSRLQSLIREMDAGENNEQHLKTLIKEKRESIASLEESIHDKSMLPGFATDYLEKIAKFRKNPPLKIIVIWNRGLIIAAAMIFTSGIGIGFLFNTLLYQIISSGSGLFLGLLFLLLARKQDKQIDAGAQDNYAKWLKDEWKNRTGQSTGLLSETLDGLVQELQNLRLNLDHTAATVGEMKTQLNKLENSLSEQIGHNRNLQKSIEDIKNTSAEWLSRKKVSSRDQYIEKSLAYRNNFQELTRWEEECREELEKKNCESLDQLKRDCERRLNLLDKEAVPNQGKSDIEIKQLENLLKGKNSKLETSRSEQTLAMRSIDREQGEITGSLGDVPGAIIRTQKAIRQIENQIDQIKMDRHAASIARDIFNRISKDSESDLFELSQDISIQFEEIAPITKTVTQTYTQTITKTVTETPTQSPIQKVEMSELNTEAILIPDAEGQKRSLENLSSGTRDSFLLAARLALANRASAGVGILILDEPFLALDSERTANALNMLKNFQERNHCQLILFSKDEQLIHQASSIFRDAQCNTL